VPANATLERPVRTAPAHRYAGAGEEARGLALLCPTFFEYEWDEAKSLTITLFRSVGLLSRSDLPERPGHAAWPMATPEAQEPGAHRIDLAVTPLGPGGLSAALLEPLWEWVWLPTQAVLLGGPLER
jgi:alpha-mannosidase